MKRICKYCGQQFKVTGRHSSRAQYCPRDHYTTCEYCGNKFKIGSFNNGVPRTCSRECGNKLKAINTKKAIQSKT